MGQKFSSLGFAKGARSASTVNSEATMNPARHFKAAHGASTTTAGFRVVSYNVLADKYALGGYHSYAPDQYLQWTYRSPRIREELKHYNADIVCLQEVQSDVYQNEFRPWFQDQGFDGMYQPRKNIFMSGPDDGTCLFFRKDMFQLVASATKVFSDLLTVRDSDPAAAQVLEGQDEGVVMVLLQHRPSGSSLLAACTHLFWDPQWPDTKVLQAHLMCGALAAFLEEHGRTADNTGVVLGGDFNSLWRKYARDMFDTVPPGVSYLTSGVYELLSTGTLPSTHPDHPSTRRHDGRNLGFQELVAQTAAPLAQATAPEETPPPAPPSRPAMDLNTSGLTLLSSYLAANGREPPLTTRTGNFSGCLDYVWFSPGNLEVLESLDMPYPPEQGPEPAQVLMDPIPDQHTPSDHLAVGCTLQFRTT